MWIELTYCGHKPYEVDNIK